MLSSAVVSNSAVSRTLNVIPLEDMAYTLQALIAKQDVLRSLPIDGGIVVRLRQDFEMLPFTGAFIRKHQISFLPLTNEGLEQLPKNVKALCAKCSMNGQLAYVEAEFFGGDGIQGFAVFRNGETVLGPFVGDAAINEALVMLGAKKLSCRDEFDAVGLNEHRNTDAWVKKDKA
jgi:hypothetical protein